VSAQTGHPRLFREQDGDVRTLHGSTIAILGYGRLGEPLALNLRDTFADTEPSVRLIVGSDDEASSARALDAGFETVSLVEAAAEADMAVMLLPDEVQEDRCEGIFTRLRPGASIVFASGYAIAYDHVATPPDSDVLLFAPRMGGEAIRQRYLDRQGYMSYLGVEHDASGQGLARVLALAAAAGSLAFGALEMTAKQEVALDLFVEQAFGPWLGAALLSTFHVGTEAGLPPLGLLMELYLSGEMSETFSQMARDGFLPSTLSHGFAASFGGMTRALSIDREQMAEQMRGVLDEINSGAFAEALQDEFRSGYPCEPFLHKVVGDDDIISQTERDFREMTADGRPQDRDASR
jgi:ketol-acid reductoisomerase